LIDFITGCSSGHKLSSASTLFAKDSVTIGFENQPIDSNFLARREDRNLVILTFFEKFNDSVILYLNGREKWRAYISDKNNPYESSGYSGIDIGISSPDRNNLIRLELLNQKRFVEFSLNKDFPICSIQRYNGIWSVNYRNHVIRLK
jgi:hypothetical protein